MVIRVFSVVLILSPLLLTPTFVFKAAYWSHDSGMLGAVTGLLTAFGLAGKVYYSESFGKDFLMYRGPINRKSVWTGICGLETNALGWILCIVLGYTLGLNLGSAYSSLSESWPINLSILIFSSISALIQVLLAPSIFYAPLIRFLGIPPDQVKPFSASESVFGGLACVVFAEFLGVLFAAYTVMVVVLIEIAKGTVLLYLIVGYLVCMLALGIGVTVRFFVRCYLEKQVDGYESVNLMPI